MYGFESLISESPRIRMACWGQVEMHSSDRSKVEAFVVLVYGSDGDGSYGCVTGAGVSELREMSL